VLDIHSYINNEDKQREKQHCKYIHSWTCALRASRILNSGQLRPIAFSVSALMALQHLARSSRSCLKVSLVRAAQKSVGLNPVFKYEMSSARRLRHFGKILELQYPSAYKQLEIAYNRSEPRSSWQLAKFRCSTNGNFDSKKLNDSFFSVDLSTEASMCVHKKGSLWHVKSQRPTKILY